MNGWMKFIDIELLFSILFHVFIYHWHAYTSRFYQNNFLQNTNLLFWLWLYAWMKFMEYNDMTDNTDEGIFQYVFFTCGAFLLKERERLNLSAFLRTEDIGVHIVHISCVIITYTLE